MTQQRRNNSTGTYWVIRNMLYGTYLHRDLFTPLMFETEQAAERYMVQRRISRRIYKVVKMGRMEGGAADG